MDSTAATVRLLIKSFHSDFKFVNSSSIMHLIGFNKIIITETENKKSNGDRRMSFINQAPPMAAKVPINKVRFFCIGTHFKGFYK